MGNEQEIGFALGRVGARAGDGDILLTPQHLAIAQPQRHERLRHARFFASTPSGGDSGIRGGIQEKESLVRMGDFIVGDALCGSIRPTHRPIGLVQSEQDPACRAGRPGSLGFFAGGVAAQHHAIGHGQIAPAAFVPIPNRAGFPVAGLAPGCLE